MACTRPTYLFSVFRPQLNFAKLPAKHLSNVRPLMHTNSCIAQHLIRSKEQSLHG